MDTALEENMARVKLTSIFGMVSNNKNPFDRLKFNKDSHQRFQLVIKSGFNFKNDCGK